IQTQLRKPIILKTTTPALTRGSPCSVVVWCGVGLGRRHIGPPGLSQSRVTLRSNGMRGRKAANQRR
uniref:Ribosomal protein S11 n=1 Tax=Mesocestoides corti TaxID=53468 RepID=A0A5K3FE55_MESCO